MRPFLTIPSSSFAFAASSLLVICSCLANAGSLVYEDCVLVHMSNQGTHYFNHQCTDVDNKFELLQCDEDAGYCFCVDEITGRYTGSLTPMNEVLNCDIIKAQEDNGTNCNGSQRALQLHVLTNSFRREMNDKSPLPPQQTTPFDPKGFQRFPLGLPLVRPKRWIDYRRSTQTILEWKFDRLDVNLDGKISQKELLPLVEPVRKNGLKLVGCENTLMMFCDTNEDSYLTKSELVYCFNEVNLGALKNRLRKILEKNSPERYNHLKIQWQQPEEPETDSSDSDCSNYKAFYD